MPEAHEKTVAELKKHAELKRRARRFCLPLFSPIPISSAKNMSVRQYSPHSRSMHSASCGCDMRAYHSACTGCGSSSRSSYPYCAFLWSCCFLFKNYCGEITVIFEEEAA